MVNNSYPELPEIPYQRTSVEMPVVVEIAKTLKPKYGTTTLSVAYAIFRNESANGSKGVNNNYAGIQADVGKWKNLPGSPIGTCVKKDSGGEMRRFLCFDDDGYKISFELLCIKVKQRSIIGADSYFAKWVGRNPSEQEKKNFQSMISAGLKIFL